MKLQGHWGEGARRCGEDRGPVLKNMTEAITNPSRAKLQLCVRRNTALITVVLDRR